jgi:hypothetical protein
MSSESLEQLFPSLRGSHYEVTSPIDPRYNCVAWALGDTARWWEKFPFSGYYWPSQGETSETVDGWMLVFAMHGYSVCDAGEWERGFEKIAIYTTTDGEPQHVARQLDSGQWSSKLGGAQDIIHPSLEAIECPEYGSARVFMRRPQQAMTSATDRGAPRLFELFLLSRLRRLLSTLLTLLIRYVRKL